MAKIDNGYLGGFSGRLGPAIGYMWRGKWCLRSRPTKVTNPQSEAQQQHRMMFKQEVVLASKFNHVLRHTLEEVSRELHMTPCNLFIQSNQAVFGTDNGVLTVDWSRLLLSAGPVAPVEFGTPSIDEDNVLRINFTKNPFRMRADGFDSVSVYLYCPDIEAGYLSAPVYRRDGKIGIALPEHLLGHEAHVWGMVQDQQGRWSNTIYIGQYVLEPSDSMDNIPNTESNFSTEPWEKNPTIAEHPVQPNEKQESDTSTMLDHARPRERVHNEEGIGT